MEQLAQEIIKKYQPKSVEDMHSTLKDSFDSIFEAMLNGDNTLKNELIYLHYYHDDNELNFAIESFIMRHIIRRPHYYNGYNTPFEARYVAANKFKFICRKCYKKTLPQ